MSNICIDPNKLKTDIYNVLVSNTEVETCEYCDKPYEYNNIDIDDAAAQMFNLFISYLDQVKVSYGNDQNVLTKASEERMRDMLKVVPPIDMCNE